VAPSFIIHHWFYPSFIIGFGSLHFLDLELFLDAQTDFLGQDPDKEAQPRYLGFQLNETAFAAIGLYNRETANEGPRNQEDQPSGNLPPRMVHVLRSPLAQ
jgi:hypothetical protein